MISRKLKKYIDKRGWLLENVNSEIMRDFSHFFISLSKQNVIRGNHYHLKKIEWFLIIQGICEIHIEDIDTNIKEVLTLCQENQKMIMIEPNKAHAFKNIGKVDLIILAIVNKPFDHSKPDTFDYKII